MLNWEFVSIFAEVQKIKIKGHLLSYSKLSHLLNHLLWTCKGGIQRPNQKQLGNQAFIFLEWVLVTNMLWFLRKKTTPFCLSSYPDPKLWKCKNIVLCMFCKGVQFHKYLELNCKGGLTPCFRSYAAFM